MKKVLFLLFLLLIPFKTFALEDTEHYFNLVYKDNFHDDLNDIKFGGNTSMYSVIQELMSYNPTYRNISIVISYNNNTFSTLDIFLHALNVTGTYTIYGDTSTNNRETISQNINLSSNSIRFRFSSTTDSVSILDSEALSSIESCMEQNVCPSSKPTESTYTGTYAFSSSSGSQSNSTYRVDNFDSSLDYDIPLQSVLYYTTTSFTLVKPTNTSYLVRPIKYNYKDLQYFGLFPSYMDYINEPDEPVNPDNPDNPIDTNVGVWKNKVIWFVDNNSEYGVLVNLYILIFISVILLSFISFIKLINKNRG